MRSLVKAVAASCLFLSGQAFAVPVTWTDWTRVNENVVTGTMGDITVTVTGTGGSFFDGPTQTACGTNWWTQPDPTDLAYTGGTADNAPTACEQVGLNTPGTFTVTFSSAVNGLYMALLSVGQPGYTVTYDFNTPFTVDSEGRGFWGNGSYSTAAGDRLLGDEFHGTLLFGGSITSLSFATAPNEYWHAFTFGMGQQVTAVPIVGTLPLLGLGLLLMGLAGRRRR